MKYSQLQWVMRKHMHLRDCGSSPLSARTKLLLVQRKETHQKNKKQQQQQKSQPKPPKNTERKKEKKPIAKQECKTGKTGCSPRADSLP